MFISNLKFKHGIFLAPLAGVTDKTFRTICKEMGAELAFSEMVSAKAVYYGDKKTLELTETAPEEGALAIQIFGSEPEIMAYAASSFAAREDVCMIDINMGCPVTKIVKNGEGSALLKDIWKAERIIRSVKEAVSKPVTVKTRLGWEDEHEILEFSNMIETAGADALILHGRTRKQMYSGIANWDMIAKVKAQMAIPVIGNGDIFSGIDAAEKLDSSGVDGIMVGRGVLGNPWIFQDILYHIGALGSYCSSDKKDIMEMMIRQFEMMAADMGERRALLIMRKHTAWYVKGMRGSSRFRDEVFRTETKEGYMRQIKEYFVQGDI